MIRRIIDGVIAGAHRPGYKGEIANSVSVGEVDAWVEEIQEMGIRSIICLLHDDQLAYYSDLPGGLLGYYRQCGFTVGHVQVMDHCSPPLSDDQLDEVWNCFLSLEKPVLVHCSAGRDRTGQAATYIADMNRRV